MKRSIYAGVAGGVFGLGLLISGMTDTTKGGAILPMAIAWRVAARRKASVLGTSFPEPTDARLGHNLVLGSVLFGMGWGLAGLCPGPAMASLAFGGLGGLVFLLAMIVGMVAAPAVRTRVDRLAQA